MKKDFFIKCFKHFNKIIIHKAWTFYFCYKAGIIWRGITHDLSKFSPIEFFESAKYYQGDSSPINACKKAEGYSKAWFHHRGRNKHHWEYWVDEFRKGMIPARMPRKYAIELCCDWMGAARAYLGDEFSYQKEFEWVKKTLNVSIIHEDTKEFIYKVFANAAMFNEFEEYIFPNNYF